MIEITAYSDYLCPWCWPAAVRLKQLQEEFPDQLKITHKAYILRPPENSDQQRTFSEYHLDHRRRAGQASGLPYSMPVIGTPYPQSSMPALIAAKWMAVNRPAHFENFHLELFQAFFELGLDISKIQFLKQLANSFGVPEEEFAAGIGERKYEELVLQDHQESQSGGVQGIPAVMIGSDMISGAAPLEEYRQAVKRALT